jgi:hypothetical protein
MMNKLILAKYIELCNKAICPFFGDLVILWLFVFLESILDIYLLLILNRKILFCIPHYLTNQGLSNGWYGNVYSSYLHLLYLFNYFSSNQKSAMSWILFFFYIFLCFCCFCNNDNDNKFRFVRMNENLFFSW